MQPASVSETTVFNLPYRSNQCGLRAELNTVRLIAAIQSSADGGGAPTVCFRRKQNRFCETNVFKTASSD